VKITVNAPSETTRELLIEVPNNVVKAAIEKEAQKMRRQVQLPGFRKGKAPLSMIHAQYGQQIQATAIEATINEQFRAAISEENLSPLGPVEISDLEFESGKPLNFKASIEIEPEITINNLDGMVVEKEIPEVTDALLSESLKKLQYRFATVKTKDAPAAEGDQLLIDIVEVDPATGIELIGKRYPNRTLRIGENVYGDDFDNNLVGMKTGDSTIIRLPIEKRLIVGPNREQRQKSAEEAFLVKVKKIESVDVPEIDDEFVKETRYETVEALREGVRAKLQSQLEDAARDNLRKNLEREVVRLVEPPAPESMVTNYLDHFIENVKKIAKRPLDLKRLREENRSHARQKVQWFLIREKLIETEGFEISDGEIDDFLKSAAEKNGIDYERLKFEYRSGEKRENLRTSLTDDKVYDFLESRAEVRTVKRQRLDEPDAVTGR